MAKKKQDTTLVAAEFKSSALVDKLEVTGYEGVVANVRTKDEQKKKLEEEINNQKNILIMDAQVRRAEEEKKGNFYKSVCYKGTDMAPINIVYQNAYKQIDAALEPKMREQIKDAFDVFFEKTTAVQLKGDANLGELKALLGEAKFSKYFNSISTIKFKDEFMEKRAENRKTLSKEVNSVLDDYMNQMQSAPQFRLK